MTFSINANTEASVALRLLGKTNRELTVTEERISSGFKVNDAEDNASIYAIAQGMRSDIDALGGIRDGVSFGEATVNVAIEAGERILQNLRDLSTETIKAQDPTANDAAIQETVVSIINEINGIVGSAQFNGYNLLNGSDGDLNIVAGINRADPTAFGTSEITVAAEDLTPATLNIDALNVRDAFLEVGFGPNFALNIGDNDFIDFDIDTDGDAIPDQTITFEFVDDPVTTPLTAGDHIPVAYDPGDTQGTLVANLVSAMQGEGFTAAYNDAGNLEVTHTDGPVTLGTVNGLTTGAGNDIQATAVPGGNAFTAFDTVQAAMSTVELAVSRLASSATSLEKRSDFLAEMQDNLRTGLGSLVDANMAEEAAKLESLQTRQQLGLESLSIANQQPNSVLTLFG